jgi:hypothetical protein
VPTFQALNMILESVDLRNTTTQDGNGAAPELENLSLPRINHTSDACGNR